jgi:hypothetical protein
VFKHDFRANAWRREENPNLPGRIMLSNQKFASVPFESNVGQGENRTPAAKPPRHGRHATIPPYYPGRQLPIAAPATFDGKSRSI